MNSLKDAQAKLDALNEILGKGVEPLDPELLAFYEEDPWPMIRHPLLYSILHMPHLNAHTNAAFRHKKEKLQRYMADGDLEAAIWLYERPWRTAVLEKWLATQTWGIFLQDGRFCALCKNIWIDGEPQCISEHLDFWEKVFRSQAGYHWMTPKELDFLDRLPANIEVWRGEVNDGGYSWTLSEKVAYKFAHNPLYGASGIVRHGFVEKSKVFAYLTQRGEEEILIKPGHEPTENDD